MPDIQGLLNDPDFQKLDPVTRKALATRAMAQIQSQPQQGQDQPGFGSELYSQTVQPMVQADQYFQQHPYTAPFDVAKSIGQAQLDQGRQTWDALTGQGQFQGYSPWQRASSVVGHGVAAALPVLGPMAAHAGENLGQGNWGAAGADALTLAAPFLIPAVMRGVGRALPSTARASEAFGQVQNAAGDVALDTGELHTIAEKTRQLAKSGGVMPKVVRDFLTRTKDAKQGPMTYSEGRDFYSNATRVSANEYGNLTPTMQRQVVQFTQALNKSIQAAADTVGQGSTYSGAMSEYANAATNARRFEALKDFTLKQGLPAAAKGAFGLAGAGGLYGLWKALNQ